jgi:hypothetical protein
VHVTGWRYSLCWPMGAVKHIAVELDLWLWATVLMAREHPRLLTTRRPELLQHNKCSLFHVRVDTFAPCVRLACLLCRGQAALCPRQHPTSLQQVVLLLELECWKAVPVPKPLPSYQYMLQGCVVLDGEPKNCSWGGGGHNVTKKEV